MHSNTVALDSFPLHRAYLLRPFLLFLFILSTKFSVPYVLLIFPLNETLKLPFCLLPNWGEKSLTCQIPEREGGLACLHLLFSMAKPEHHVIQDCFSLNL